MQSKRSNIGVQVTTRNESIIIIPGEWTLSSAGEPWGELIWHVRCECGCRATPTLLWPCAEHMGARSHTLCQVRAWRKRQITV
jgi:hypothetical protein